MVCKLLGILLVLSFEAAMATTVEHAWTTTTSINGKSVSYSIILTKENNLIEIFLVNEEESNAIKKTPSYALVFINKYLREGQKLKLTLEREYLVPISQTSRSKYYNPDSCHQKNSSQCIINIKSISDFSGLTSGPGERQVLRYEFDPKGLILYRPEGRLYLRKSSIYKNSSLLHNDNKGNIIEN